MRELALFTGAGGGVLGGKLLGWTSVGYVEIDPFCQEVLRRRVADGCLDAAPIFGDIRRFIADGYADAYSGLVDVISAGFPCPPVSTAGKRLAQADDRWLWPEVAECIRRVVPGQVFLENVPGLLSAGDGTALRDVLWDLATLGYDAEWTVLGADDLGAPHRRKRLWILAYRPSNGRHEGRTKSGGVVGGSDAAERGVSVVAAGPPLWPSGPEDRNAWAAVLQRWPDLAPAVESPVRKLAYELPDMVDGALMQMNPYDIVGVQEVISDVHERSRQVVFGLWRETGQKAVSQFLGGVRELSQAQVLRCGLHGQCHDEAGRQPSRPQEAGREVEGGCLCGMRECSGFACSSHRWRAIAQHTRECADPMRVMPSEVALVEWAEAVAEACRMFGLWPEGTEARLLPETLVQIQEVWRSASDEEKNRIALRSGARLSLRGQAKNRRTEQLRALGNAQVPVVAAAAFCLLARRAGLHI